MGACSARVFQEEMGLINGRQRDGIVLGQRFISYFLVESALLEYPGVAEAGVTAECLTAQDPSAGQRIKVFLALEESAKPGFALEVVIEYIRQRFAILTPITIGIRDKLPMTRSGKIMRTVLREWT